ncbi:succinylglutamate desuccinylase/aspartoacylase family protein [Shewanella algae]|uniref:Succinylglutamate desuccinylase n=1 Tax=Shewanella algae TaxID=38313 RepID=A0AAD1KC97_9GAMM|nr:succinylglutamate desuccinylase/aspartoacylase family protein [Shewanella algae]MBO2562377.1 succinylglutamate desuccinylase/aspartoacylase family protein [Shewanella algae]MBO2596605.1 succinylglutamate desuccinylase/aspartoacylase family protein [Shewanella algae]MBO2630058.1 succinylglutamate desuccinylase/aspartoacylase family protein [Shewanella algae]MBO2663802.1 succinylglutamate desuccinylase/aspartoacylase family protein [Shewanella algae]MBO2667965.1 succinylglutamate desuccinylas
MQLEHLPVGELAAGQPLTIPVYRFKGTSDAAPSVYIQANVHGAEVQGNAVILQLLQYFKAHPPLGDITLVPLANPLGINQKSGEFTLGRFDPITGINWNRAYLDQAVHLDDWYLLHGELPEPALFDAFRRLLIANCEQALANPWGVTTGQRLALNLQKLAHCADIVLDLHTGPKSCKHLYCPEYELSAAGYFHIPYTLVMPKGFGGAMDEAAFNPWWQLSDYANSRGRELKVAVSAFTLELGSQERIDLADASRDAEGILSYLSYREVIAQSIQPEVMSRFACMLKDYRKFHAPMAGMVEYLAEPGVPLAAGAPLVNMLRLDRVDAGTEVTRLSLNEDVIPVLHFASASVHQGTELYKVMTNYFTLSG